MNVDSDALYIYGEVRSILACLSASQHNNSRLNARSN